MGEQSLTGRSQGDTAAIAIEDRLPQFDFEGPYLAAQRRLGNAQHGRRAREATQFRHVHEAVELLRSMAHSLPDGALLCRSGLEAS